MQDNPFGRLVGVLVAPGKTFEAIAQRPSWAVALVVLCLLVVISNLVAVPRIDWEASTRAQLEKSGRELPEAQMEQAIEMGAKVGPIFAYLAPVFVVGGYLLMALACWILFNLLGGETTFKKSLSTSLHATMPWGLASLLTLPILLSQAKLDAERLQNGGYLLSSLGALAGDNAGPIARSLLGSLDLFSAWTVVLLAIGFTATARLSRGKAAAGAVVLWALWIGIKLGLVSLGQAFS